MTITPGIETVQWRCEACGRVRPDADIAVYSRDVSAAMGLPPAMAIRNVCYCVDQPSCRARAEAIVENFLACVRAGL